MKTNKKEIHLNQEDIDLIAEAAEQRGEHWNEILERQLHLLRGNSLDDPVRVAQASGNKLRTLLLLAPLYVFPGGTYFGVACQMSFYLTREFYSGSTTTKIRFMS